MEPQRNKFSIPIFFLLQAGIISTSALNIGTQTGEYDLRTDYPGFEWNFETHSESPSNESTDKTALEYSKNNQKYYTVQPVTTDKNFKQDITLIDDDFDIPSANNKQMQDTSAMHETTLPDIFEFKEGSGEENTIDFAGLNGSGDSSDETVTTIISTTENLVPNTENLAQFSKECLENVCNKSELYINGMERILKIPENSNYTVICSYETNSTGKYQLYWYEETSTVLHATTEQTELKMILTNTTTFQSGSYKCIKQTDTSCCHSELRLKIYTIPNYRYHLTVAGIVTIISFVIGIIAGTWRSWKIKKYAKQFQNLKKSKEQPLLP